MEVKILCHCGVKYKFDVEPVDGRMPVPVNCPDCALDGTEFANAHIRQNLGIATPPPIPVALPITAIPTAPAANPGVPRLRVAATVPAEAPPEQVADAPPAEPPVARPIRVPVPAIAPAKTKGPPSFGLGLAGALLGTIVGVGLWLLVHNFIGAKSKFLILGVGFFAGLGARYLSRDEGSQQLGMIAAALTLMGVFGTQYYIAYQDMFGFDPKELATEDFQMEVTEAKKVLAQMPNESDQEIRVYLASAHNEENEDEEEVEKIDAKSITDEDIKFFKDESLPRYKGLVSGAIVVDELQKEAEKNVEEMKESAGVKLWLVVQGFGMFKLGLLIASCGLAYRVSANA